MIKTLAFLMLVFFLVLQVGCSSMNLEDFKNTEPKLVVEDYFLGQTRGWGLVYDRFGKLRRQFVVDMEGTWEGAEFVIREQFVFDDGEKQARTWRLKKLAENNYVGTADDVIGEAQGRSAGNAISWKYRLKVKVGSRMVNMDFDDWLILQPNQVLLNRAEMSRFGFKLGELFVSFAKQ